MFDLLYGSMFWMGSTTCCLFSVMFLYNLYAGAQFRREEHEDKPSRLSMAAWGVGLLAYVMPCCPGVLPVTAMIMAAVERRRIYQGRSALASSTPARLGNINGVMALVGHALMMGGYLMQAGSAL